MRYLTLTYLKKPNGKLDESMEVSQRLRSRDLQTAAVILDFRLKLVIKASMAGVSVPKDFDRITQYYHQHYASTIEQLLTDNGHTLISHDQESI